MDNQIKMYSRFSYFKNCPNCGDPLYESQIEPMAVCTSGDIQGNGWCGFYYKLVNIYAPTPTILSYIKKSLRNPIK